MTSKTWSAGTVIDSAWLQDANDLTYLAASQSGKAKFNRELVSIWDYFPSTSFDPSLDVNYLTTTTAFNTAIATGKRVYVPLGTYVVEDVTLLANTEIFGEGWKSIIKQRAAATSNHFCFVIGQNDAADAASTAQYQNINIHDLQFLGRVTTEAFLEFTHLVSLNNVKDTTIERCFFNGFRGDGLYVGTGILGNELHNKNIRIRDCLFDGVNNDNRNAISIIDCDGIIITNNKFINCTRSNMPGAIDFEPNVNTWPIIKNAYILNNIFNNIGGNVGVIAIEINSTVTSIPTNIQIIGNSITNSITSTGHAEINFDINRVTTAADVDQNIIIKNNFFSTGSIPFRIFAAKGISIENNTWQTFTNGGLIGFNGGTDYCRNLTFKNNRILRCATASLVAIAIFSVDYFTFDGNLLSDNGSGAAGSYALDFNTGISSYVRITNNDILAVTGKTTNGIIKEAGHTFTPSTNKYFNNNLNGLSNSFQGKFGSVIYDPPNLADGVGTTTTVSCAGALLGDFATAGFSLSLQGITMTAFVSATDTVSVRFQNESGGALDLGSGTLNVLAQTL